jgi:hypothetical protein
VAVIGVSGCWSSGRNRLLCPDMKLRVGYEPTASGMLSPILETLICDVDATKRGRPELKSRNQIMFINVMVPVSLPVSFYVT